MEVWFISPLLSSSLPYSLQEPAPSPLDQCTSPDQSPGITLAELNEKEVAQPQQDSIPESSAGVVKRRRVSRTEKEKVQLNGYIDSVYD